jgi:tRNA(adenine34) deaminase
MTSRLIAKGFFLFVLSITPIYCWILPPLISNNLPKIVPLQHDSDLNATHSYFMSLALDQARKAEKYGEVPIGAVIVQRTQDGKFKVLSKAHNLVETTHDASAHAELLAMRKAARKYKNWRLLNTTLYSTLEPCPICLSAAQAFRVSNIVYGAPDLRLGAIKTHIQLLEVDHPFHTIEEVVPDVLAAESSSLLKSFFHRRRKNMSKSKLAGTLRARLRRLFSK